MKKFSVLFITQFILYSIVCISYLAIVHKNFLMIALTDVSFASINYFVIKKIAKDDDSIYSFLGYTCGSTLGSLFGTWISPYLEKLF